VGALVVDRWAVTFWYSAQSLLAVPNVTAHPSTASVPVYCYMMVRCYVVLMWRLKG